MRIPTLLIFLLTLITSNSSYSQSLSSNNFHSFAPIVNNFNRKVGVINEKSKYKILFCEKENYLKLRENDIDVGYISYGMVKYETLDSISKSIYDQVIAYSKIKKEQHKELLIYRKNKDSKKCKFKNCPLYNHRQKNHVWYHKYLN